jgi:hypothetical protein
MGTVTLLSEEAEEFLDAAEKTFLLVTMLINLCFVADAAARLVFSVKWFEIFFLCID